MFKLNCRVIMVVCFRNVFSGVKIKVLLVRLVYFEEEFCVIINLNR